MMMIYYLFIDNEELIFINLFINYSEIDLLNNYGKEIKKNTFIGYLTKIILKI